MGSIEAREFFKQAYNKFPVYHNVDEIYNKVLTSSRIDEYRNASKSSKSEILSDIFNEILGRYSWGMPNDLRDKMGKELLKNYEIKIFYKGASQNAANYIDQVGEIKKKLEKESLDKVFLGGAWSGTVSDFQIRYERVVEAGVANALERLLSQVYPDYTFRQQTIKGTTPGSISIFLGP